MATYYVRGQQVTKGNAQCTVEQARRNQQPCEYQPENRQFDFWLGECSVVPTSGGGPVGA